MRLTEDEQIKIIKAIESNISLTEAQLRLFGSRVNDDKKGGDIDLLLLVKKDNIEKILSMKLDILISIKDAIGDQKIDLKVALFDDVQTDNFLKLIFPDSKLLKEW